MSQAPTPDPHLECHVHHDRLCPGPLRESTNTPVKHFFTASQKKSQWLTAQELLEGVSENINEEAHSKSLKPLTGLSELPKITTPNPWAEMTNLELQTTLLTIVQQSNSHPQKKPWVIKKPNPFSRGSPDELHAFIFQCQIYFCVCDKEFNNDAEKVFFAISYLRGIVLDYFEPFINKSDPNHNLDFLEDWLVFVQKLSNIFGSYSLEDDDEDAIVSIPCPHNGKAINYFIQFAKYQNHIYWDNQALQKIVKDAISSRIKDEL